MLHRNTSRFIHTTFGTLARQVALAFAADISGVQHTRNVPQNAAGYNEKAWRRTKKWWISRREQQINLLTNNLAPVFAFREP